MGLPADAIKETIFKESFPVTFRAQSDLRGRPPNLEGHGSPCFGGRKIELY